MFRVAKYSLVAIPLFALLTTAACGSKKPPTPPSMDSIDASDTDMPAPSSTVATAADAGPPADAAAPGVPDPGAAATTLALPTATAKIALKGKKPGNVELKSDGSVMSAGKLAGKISGMALQNADGKAVLTVGSDGAVTADGAAYGSFAGDELTLAKGDKVGIGDDGTITMTTGGKAATLGKFENVGAAKRASVLAVAFVVAPPAAGKPATPAKPPGKPKTAPKKP